jgi:hypothetical protein
MEERKDEKSNIFIEERKKERKQERKKERKE